MTSKFGMTLSRRAAWTVGISVAMGIAMLWAEWQVLADMAHVWASDPTYSHGYLVPLIALAILWSRREETPNLLDRPNWWGVAIVAVGAIMQYFGGLYHVRWLSGCALLGYLAGIVVMLAGWRALRWSGPAIVFLLFMIPLPWRIMILMQYPLQHISTVMSGFVLQALGFPAVVEGNVIYLTEVDLGVIDACSGLKMLVVFVALSTAIVLLSKRRAIEKPIIVASAIPIAIISNVMRITLTGICYETVGSEWAHVVFHDVAGWMMMAFGLALLFCELRYLSVLFVEEAPPEGPRFATPRMIKAMAR